jgi:hypothetical protein
MVSVSVKVGSGYRYLDIVEGTNSRFANRHVEKRDLGKGGKALKREYHK